MARGTRRSFFVGSILRLAVILALGFRWDLRSRIQLLEDLMVDALADSLLSIRREIGPGHLLKSIGDGRSVKYVVIQASFTTELSFPSPADDKTLVPLITGKTWVAREYDTKLGCVFEVAKVVGLFGGDTVLRVGLDATPLVTMRRDIIHRTVMRAVFC